MRKQCGEHRHDRGQTEDIRKVFQYTFQDIEECISHKDSLFVKAYWEGFMNMFVVKILRRSQAGS